MSGLNEIKDAIEQTKVHLVTVKASLTTAENNQDDDAIKLASYSEQLTSSPTARKEHSSGCRFVPVYYLPSH